MKKILLFLLLLSTLLTVYLAYRQFTTGSCRLNEGFEADKADKAEKPEKQEPNALLSLMGNLKRINGYLMDPEMWSHRIGLIGMTPVEMARQELTKNKKS